MAKKAVAKKAVKKAAKKATKKAVKKAVAKKAVKKVTKKATKKVVKKTVAKKAVKKVAKKATKKAVKKVATSKSAIKKLPFNKSILKDDDLLLIQIFAESGRSNPEDFYKDKYVVNKRMYDLILKGSQGKEGINTFNTDGVDVTGRYGFIHYEINKKCIRVLNKNSKEVYDLIPASFYHFHYKKDIPIKISYLSEEKISNHFYIDEGIGMPEVEKLANAKLFYYSLGDKSHCYFEDTIIAALPHII